MALLGVIMGIANASTGMREHGLLLEAMAAGVAEALITTAVGLLVAFPAVSLYRSLSGQARKRV